MLRLVHANRFLFMRRFASSLRDEVDVVIAGGGMIGSCMALALSRSAPFRGSRIVLLEAASKPISLPSATAPRKYSNRVSAINPSSRKLFEQLNEWDSIAKVFKELLVFDSCSTSHISFAQPDGSDVAYIVENDRIVAALNEQIGNAQIDVRYGAKAKEYKLPEVLADLAEVELVNGERLKTRLLIGADGSESLVRKAMKKAKVISWKYGQKAIVATLNIAVSGVNDVAWQRFTPRGLIALLPLDDETSSLVWTTTSEEAPRLEALADESFVDELNRALVDDAGQMPLVNSALSFLDRVCFGPPPRAMDFPIVMQVVPESRASVPLSLVHAAAYVAPRVALIGDAAHRVHPLAGQGVNLGFGDVATLAELMSGVVARGGDLGGERGLHEYEARRQRHNVPVMFAIDALNRLYANQFPPVVLARSVGLNAVDRMRFAKKFFMERASSSA